MDINELNKIMDDHQKWRRGEEGGKRADLSGMNLSGMDLSGRNLSWANLSGVNLSWANLRWANLSGANLSWANLSGVKNLNKVKNLFWPMACPDTGSFIGWKKCSDGLIVKMEIPADALRSSSTGRKCRCDKAAVLEIQNLDGSKTDNIKAASEHDSAFIYAVGETVSVDNFDENRWEECAPGIHFFITREEAVRYEL